MTGTQVEATLRRSPGAQLVRRLLVSRVIGQAAVYAAASGAAMGLSGVGKAIIAREMSPSSFGTFAFAISFATLVAVVFDFGIYSSASRRLARSGAGDRREIVGALLVAFVPLAALTSGAMFGLSFVVDGAFHAHAGSILRAGSILAWAWTFPLLGELTAKGADRLHVFSISNLAGSVGLVVALLAFIAAGVHFSAEFAYLVLNISFVGSLVMLWIWLKPKFQRVRVHIAAFVADTRAWAFQSYVGRFFSIGTYNMDVLMVAWFSDAKSTGYYSLAAALAGFMGLPMMGLAAALFPRMAHEDSIDRRWVGAAWAMAGLALIAVLLVVPPLVDLVFSKNYSPVASLAIPLVLATGVRGVTTVYNTFMSAHARGREMRNVAMILTGSNLVFNFALIPPFGATGAAWASLLALLVNYAAYVTYYRRYVSSRQPARS